MILTIVLKTKVRVVIVVSSNKKKLWLLSIINLLCLL